MHLPTSGVPLRGLLLRIVARVTAFAALRRVLLGAQLKETRIRELPSQW